MNVRFGGSEVQDLLNCVFSREGETKGPKVDEELVGVSDLFSLQLPDKETLQRTDTDVEVLGSDQADQRRLVFYNSISTFKPASSSVVPWCITGSAPQTVSEASSLGGHRRLNTDGS
eukprot:s5038_g3.t1